MNFVRTFDLFQDEALSQNDSIVSSSIEIALMRDIYATIMYTDSAGNSASIAVTYEVSMDNSTWSAAQATDITASTGGSDMDMITIGVVNFIRVTITENDVAAATIRAWLGVR